MQRVYAITVAMVLAVIVASFGTGIYSMWHRPTLDWNYNDILALRDDSALGISRELHRSLAGLLPVMLVIYLVISLCGNGFREAKTRNRVGGLVTVTAALALVGALWLTGGVVSTASYVIHCVVLPIAFAGLFAASIWMLYPKASYAPDLIAAFAESES